LLYGREFSRELSLRVAFFLTGINFEEMKMQKKNVLDRVYESKKDTGFTFSYTLPMWKTVY
jgi:hypothetical protein